MILLTRGRISFGGFLCLPDPFWVMTLLVTEFVVSPIHDYTTFSSYGSRISILVLNLIRLFLIFFFSPFLFCSFGDAAMFRGVLLYFSTPSFCIL